MNELRLIDHALDRFLGARYTGLIGTPASLALMRKIPVLPGFDPRLLTPGRYVYYRSVLAQCCTAYDAGMVRLLLGSERIFSEETEVTEHNCQISALVESVPPNIDPKTPAGLQTTAPNTFVYGYQLTQIQHTYLDIKRYFRNSGTGQERWTLHFHNPITGHVPVDDRGAFHVASTNSHGWLGWTTTFAPADRPKASKEDRVMQFRCPMVCSQLQLNIFVVLHHWAEFDSEKPGADNAVALMADAGPGFDSRLPSLAPGTRLSPEQFTVQACFMNWIEDFLVRMTRAFTHTPATYATGLDVDSISDEATRSLEDEIRGIFIMLTNVINPIACAGKTPMSESRIRVLQARAAKIVLAAANAVFDTNAKSASELQVATTRSLRQHLMLFWGTLRFVRIDQDKCRARPASQLSGFRLGEVVSWESASAAYDLVHLKLFSDARAGDTVLIKTVEDRWIVAEFGGSAIDKCPQQAEFEIFQAKDPDAYLEWRRETSRRNEYTLEKRTFVFSAGKGVKTTTANLGCVWVLKDKRVLPSKAAPSATAQFFVELSQYPALFNIDYVIDYLRALFLKWAEQDDMDDIQNRVDQLVFGWAQHMCNLATQNTFRLDQDGWYTQHSVRHFFSRHSIDRFMDTFEAPKWQTFKGFVTDAMDYALGTDFDINFDRITSSLITGVADWKVRSETLFRADALKFIARHAMVGQTIDASLLHDMVLQPIRLGREVQPGDIVLIPNGAEYLVAEFSRFAHHVWASMGEKGPRLEWDMDSMDRLLRDEDEPREPVELPGDQVLNGNTLELVYTTDSEGRTCDLRNVFYVTRSCLQE